MAPPSNPYDVLRQLLTAGGTNPLKTPATPEDVPIRQNFMLPEPGTPGFFGQHPNLSHGIENAFLMAANIPDSNTPGEAISSIARAALGLRAMRQQHMAEQMMIPLQWQRMQQDVDAKNAEMEKNRAEARLNTAKANAYGGGVNLQDTAAFDSQFEEGGLLQHIGAQYPDLANSAKMRFRQTQLIPDPEARMKAQEAIPKDLETEFYQRETNRIRDAREDRLNDQPIKPSFTDAVLLHSRGWTQDDVMNDPAKAKVFIKDQEQHAGVIQNAKTKGSMNAEGKLDYLSQQGLETTRQLEAANIVSQQRDLEQFKKSPYALAAANVQRDPNKSPAENTKALQDWIKKHTDDLQNEINTRQKALRTYPSQLLLNPALSYEDHLNATRNGGVLKYDPATNTVH